VTARDETRRQPLAQSLSGLAGKDDVVAPRAQARQDPQPPTLSAVVNVDARHDGIPREHGRIPARREHVDLGVGQQVVEEGQERRREDHIADAVRLHHEDAAERRGRKGSGRPRRGEHRAVDPV
jgi:hypothetical protein